MEDKMKFDNFVDFDRYGDELAAKGKNDEVLDLFLRASEVLPKEDYEVNYFLITSYLASLYRKSDRLDESYNIAKELIDNGYACGIWTTKEISRRNHVELMEKNRILLENAQSKAKMEYKVCLPNDYTSDQKYPVVFALHGDGVDGNIHNLSLYWTSEVFTDQGIITVYVQSSQVYSHGGYQWNRDPEIARKEIRDCLREVTEQYSIDTSQIIVGGFSGGAMISVDFALGEVIPIKGFISLCPASVSNYYSVEKAEGAAKRNIKGVILEGELDLEPSIKDLIKGFDETGTQYKYVINEGIGHVCPKDLTEKLEEAVTFILGHKE
jgi:predicted esterase